MSARWTQAEEATLIVMMLEGKSAGLVADAIGKTRDAVMGRSHRMGLKWDSQFCKQLGRPVGGGGRRLPEGKTLIRAAGC